ncbi:MAG: alpha/beta hydrolase [Desulfobacterales bacterium]
MGGILISGIIFAAGGLSLLYWLQGSLIFFPQGIPHENRKAFGGWEVRVRRDDVELHGWFVEAPISPANPLVVYYGGNAEEVSGNLWMRDNFGPHALLLVNYRGYGDSGGRPSESHLFEDAVFVLDRILADHDVDASAVVLMGRSLGSGVAAHVASRRPVRGVILVTPFDSLVSVARRHYPFLPVRRLLRHRFDSASIAPRIQTPLLSLVAGSDEIVPRDSALRLADRWGGPKRMVIVDGAYHNDIEHYEVYWREIRQFLSEIAASKPDQDTGKGFP